MTFLSTTTNKQEQKSGKQIWSVAFDCILDIRFGIRADQLTAVGIAIYCVKFIIPTTASVCGFKLLASECWIGKNDISNVFFNKQIRNASGT